MASACTNISATIPPLLSSFASQNPHLVGINDIGQIIGVVSVSAEPFINAFNHSTPSIPESVFLSLGLDTPSESRSIFPPGSNSALYAHSKDFPTTPASFLIGYSLPESIQASEETVRELQVLFKGVLVELVQTIEAVSVAEGETPGKSPGLGSESSSVSAVAGPSPSPTSQTQSPQKSVVPALLYPNYAFADTPLDAMYGSSNVRRMKRLVKKVDPKGVMKLTGGFLFQ